MKLSVLVHTYNHSGFIEQALESVVTQRTDFDFEIVIADDCSADGTREIVRDFAVRHPDEVSLILPEENLGRGGTTIFYRQLEAARGQYLALLDGDDYWTSSEKLQRQIDLLDAHPEYSTCFHDVDVEYEDPAVPSHRYHQDRPVGWLMAAKPKPVSNLSDIIRSNFIPTCSAVLRNPGRLPDWYFSLMFEDWPLYVLSAERGDLAYLDEVMGVYRVHPGGVWSSDLSQFRSFKSVVAYAEVYEAINRHLDYRFDSTISKDVAWVYERGAVELQRAGERGAAAECARRSLHRTPLRGRTARWRAFAVLAANSLRMRGEFHHTDDD